MQGSHKTSPLRTYGAKQEWGRKRRKAEAKTRRTAAKVAWKKDQGVG